MRYRGTSIVLAVAVRDDSWAPQLDDPEVQEYILQEVGEEGLRVLARRVLFELSPPVSVGLHQHFLMARLGGTIWSSAERTSSSEPEWAVMVATMISSDMFYPVKVENSIVGAHCETKRPARRNPLSSAQQLPGSEAWPHRTQHR